MIPKTLSSALMILSLLAGAPFLHAQKQPFSAVVKSSIKTASETTASSNIKEQLKAAYLQRLEKEGVEDIEAMLENYWAPGAQQARTAQFAAQNQELNRALVKNWLQADLYAAAREELIRRAAHIAVTDELIAYGALIPADSRVVLLGEIHEEPWVTHEVWDVINHYRKTYPDRRVYYASEFIDASPRQELGYALKSESEIFHLCRKRPYYRQLTTALMRAGVSVVGLENPSITDLVLMSKKYPGSLTDVARWETTSAVGIRNRNLSWTRHINQLLSKDPQAVVFVHAGLAHTNYNHPASLGKILKPAKPFVIEFTSRENQDYNTLLERNLPIPVKILQQGRQLTEQSNERVRFLRLLTDPEAAQAVGCNLNVKYIFF